MNDFEPDVRPILMAMRGADAEPDTGAVAAGERMPVWDEAEYGQRERSIRMIRRKGLEKRPGLVRTLVGMIRSLGLRNLLFGLWDCVFIGLIASIVIWAAIIGGVSQTHWLNRTDRLFGLVVPVFVCSPALFLVVHFLVVVKERNLNTLNLIRTCRWSFRQIATVRMFLFGMVSMMVSSLATVLLVRTANPGLPTMIILGICFSSLFLFSLLQMWAEGHLHTVPAMVLVPALWILAGLVIQLMRSEIAPYLMAIPPILSLATGLTLLAVFLVVLHRYCTGDRLEKRVENLGRPVMA